MSTWPFLQHTISCPTLFSVWNKFCTYTLDSICSYDFGRPFVKRFVLCYQTVVCPVLSVLSVTLVYCDQTVGWIKMKLCTQVGLGAGHFVLHGDPALPSTKGHSPQFSAHICSGQMTRWIKMPLSRKLGLGPSDIVLDGDPALPSPKKGQPPIFRLCLLCPNGGMDQGAT